MDDKGCARQHARDLISHLLGTRGLKECPGYPLYARALSELDAPEKENFEAAGKYCVQGVRLSEQREKPYGVAAGHLLLGAILLLQCRPPGDLPAAKEHFDRAAEIFGNTQNRFEKGLALLGAAWTRVDDWKMRGGPGRLSGEYTVLFGQVLQGYQEALESFREVNSDLAGTAQRCIEEATCLLGECIEAPADKKAAPPRTAPPRVSLSVAPILGPIAAGKPTGAYEADSIEGYATIDRLTICGVEYRIERLGTGRRSELPIARWFIARVVGNSMNKYRPPICHECYVLFRRPSDRDFRSGDVVAAIIPDVDRQATLKQLMGRPGAWLLRPYSTEPQWQESFPVTPATEIVGIAEAVLREIQPGDEIP